MNITKSIKYLLLAAVLIFLLYWGGCLAKCEILTYLHGDEFSEAYKENTMIGPQKYWKVISYSGDTASVYFVAENRAFGNLLQFEFIDGQWVHTTWDTVWSKTGSADGFIWPYIR